MTDARSRFLDPAGSVDAAGSVDPAGSVDAAGLVDAVGSVDPAGFADAVFLVDPLGARQALLGGTAVVLPNPAPLTYVVAATTPDTVNTAKGRPAGQAVALWAHHPDILAALDDVWALPPEHARAARRLLDEELLTLLVPLRPDTSCPDWLAPASRDGWALLFGARWTPLLPVLTASALLYVSSANRSGHPPAETAEAAAAMFASTVPVLPARALTGDDEQPATGRRHATTTVRIHPDGHLELHRHGAQDRPYPTAEAYLHHLRA